MKTYLIKRFFQSLFAIFGITVVLFVILHMTGDPTYLLLPEDTPREEIAIFRHEMGFDKPLYTQYYIYMKGILHGDFGKSWRHGESSMKLVLERLPATIELTVVAFIIALGIAVPVGVYSAYKPNSTMDHFGMTLVLAGQSMPGYWLALMFILLFSVKMNLLPAYGRSGIESLIMPATSLGFYSLARIARVTRSSMMTVLKRDYIRTAKAKGLSDSVVIFRHALKNAAIPIITLVGMDFGRLLGGAVITETIFAWPGVGRLAIQAIYNRDFPVVQAAVFILAFVFVLINFIVDIMYTYLDPRVRLDGGAEGEG